MFLLDLGGFKPDNEEAKTAKDALAFMTVGVNSSWKIPIGYFLVSGLSAKGRIMIYYLKGTSLVFLSSEKLRIFLF